MKVLGMIGAILLAIVAPIIWVLERTAAMRRESKISKAKESHDDAKKIVESKTSDQLVDDFNERFKRDGSGEDGSH